MWIIIEHTLESCFRKKKPKKKLYFVDIHVSVHHSIDGEC